METRFSRTIHFYLSTHTGLPKNCYKGIFLNFIQSTFAGAFYFFSIYFVEVLHFNISVSGVIISFYGLGTIIGGWVGGNLSDKKSPVIVLIFSLFAQSLTFLFLMILKHPIWLFLDLFCLGLATYSFLTSNSTWILSHCTKLEDRLKAINSMAVASNLGIGLSAIIMGELSKTSFKYIFLFSGFFFLLLALFLARQLKIGEFDDRLTAANSLSLLSRNAHEIVVDNNLSENNRMITFALICLFFTGMIVSQLSATYPLFLVNSFPLLGIHAFTYLFCVSICLIVVFQNSLVNYCATSNKILMIGVGSFLIGCGMLMLNFSSIFAIALFSCVIYSFGEMVFFSMVQLYVYQHGRAEKKGGSLGKYRMVYASSRFLGPTAGSAIYHFFGPSTLWYLSGLIGLFFLLMSYRYRCFI